MLDSIRSRRTTYTFGLLLIWLCSTSAAAQPATTTPPDLSNTDTTAIRVASEFTDALTTGKFEQATAAFDATVKAALTPQQLEAMWQQITASNGALKTVDKASTKRVDQLTVVLIPLEFEKSRLQMQVVVDTTSHIAGLHFQPDGSVPPNKPDAHRPAYLDEDVLTQREVTVGDDEWALKGNLALPRHGTPRAVFVFVHGSGPHDRDETVGQSKPFRDLAYGLAANGIASLRYDKRTKVHGAKMKAGEISIKNEVVIDALRALEVARAQPELKNVPVYLLGHSLGATLTPEIAKADGRLAGAVIAAGVARPFDEVILDQFEYIASLPDGKQAAAMLPELREQIDQFRAGKLADSDALLGAPVAYWRDLCDHDAEAAIANARSVKCRFLILQGGRDYQATADDYKIWIEKLADQPTVTHRLFPDLNHLFATGAGKATPAEYNELNYVDPSVIECITDWCKDHRAGSESKASGKGE